MKNYRYVILKKIYMKPVNSIGLKMKYYYLLNYWFDKQVYKDVFKYIEEVECKFFIDCIPFYELGLD